MLELAKREGPGPVTIADIAAEQDIPTRFLEAILRQLKQAGLTDSARGKEGGYFLAKPARSIMVGDVIRLFEGPLVAVNANASATPNSQPVPSTVVDVFEDVWKKAGEALSSVYDAVDFAVLAEEDKTNRAKFVSNYAI